MRNVICLFYLFKVKDDEAHKEEPIIKITASSNVNNLDDFVPDDVLDKSFLEDAGHGDIIVKVSKDIELDSDERLVSHSNITKFLKCNIF